MQLIKDKLIRKIMTGLLSLSGNICPDFLYQILDELKVSKRTREIVELRYIKGIKFEAIPDLLKRRCELRQVFKVHKDFIDLLYGIIMSTRNKS